MCIQYKSVVSISNQERWGGFNTYRITFSFLIIVLCINDLYRLSGSSDHKGIQQHLIDSGNDIVISHSSLTDVTFCRVDVPFLSDPLHITLPTDPRYIDKTR